MKLENYGTESYKIGKYIFEAKVKYSGNHMNSDEVIYGGYYYDIEKEKHYIHYTEIDTYGNICRQLNVEVKEDSIRLLETKEVEE